MRNVTMVVPVLMMSCQVSEKPKTGPLAAQTTTIAHAEDEGDGPPGRVRDGARELGEQLGEAWRLSAIECLRCGCGA